MLDGHPRSEDAALVVSELGTIAVVHTASGHSGGTFHVALTVSLLAVVIEVTDSGTSETSPQAQRPTPESTHGRGLGMVAALTDRLRIQGGAPGHDRHAEPRLLGRVLDQVSSRAARRIWNHRND
ncbi:ATP-binding protein [Streptomyces sp. NPDC047813]|uniref:ATP-binding protein n=1 Tax=Streptomyces sp. NPDC047813 TaxID=3154608 RepID=UPI0033DED70E